MYNKVGRPTFFKSIGYFGVDIFLFFVRLWSNYRLGE